MYCNLTGPIWENQNEFSLVALSAFDLPTYLDRPSPNLALRILSFISEQQKINFQNLVLQCSREVPTISTANLFFFLFGITWKEKQKLLERINSLKLGPKLILHCVHCVHTDGNCKIVKFFLFSGLYSSFAVAVEYKPKAQQTNGQKLIVYGGPLINGLVAASVARRNGPDANSIWQGKVDGGASAMQKLVL